MLFDNNAPKLFVKIIVLGFVTLFSFGHFFNVGLTFSSKKPVFSNPGQVLGVTLEPIRGPQVVKNTSNFVKICEPDLAKITAKSFLVYQPEGEIFLEKNGQKKIAIASLTKLMTGLVVYKTTGLFSTFVVPNKFYTNIKPSLGILANDGIKITDLFNSMIIGSNNDAAEILSDYVSTQTEIKFETLMNEFAKILNMNNSHFQNSTGFDAENNYSTAYDIKKLVDETQKYSAFVILGKVSSYKFSSTQGKNYTTTNTNKLLKSNSTLDSIKTGYTEQALGSMVSKIHQKGANIIFIILGSQNRENDTKILIENFMKCFVAT